MNPSISRLITITRFPIILGPVLIHTHWPYPDGEHDSFFEHFCAGDIGFITVPLYYLVAGFLFFQHYDNSLFSYKTKISKRIHSLLIPYLIWNFIAYIIYAFIQNSMAPAQFWESFWVVTGKGGHSPADGPLWFVRTLMILMIASPLFYFISKSRFSAIIVFGVLLLWIFNIPGMSSGTVLGGVFFLIGCYLAINHLDEKGNRIERYEWMFYTAFVVLVFVDNIVGREVYLGKIIYHLILFIGMFVYYYLAKRIPEGKISIWLSYLAGFSFFTFSIHEMLVCPIQNQVLLFMGKGVVSYMVVFLLVVTLSLIVGLLCKRYMAMVFKILSGNR